MEINQKNFKVIQIQTPCLSHFCYYIESSSEAIIIDPLRDIEPYKALLKKNKASLKYIIETHFHADFVSGHCNLKKETNAEILMGVNSEANFEHFQVQHDQEIQLGKITLRFLLTPGHTLESICILLLDEGKEKYLFSGDSLFIGDVGRPDLAVLENFDEKFLARKLFGSLKILKNLSDDCVLLPGHGAGSSCGKNISNDLFSTIGKEKIDNYAFKIDDEEVFVEKVLENLKPPPEYFFETVKMNQNNQTVEFTENVIKKNLNYFSLEKFEELSLNEEDYQILDTRNIKDFKNGYIKGSINVPLTSRFAIFAATVLDLNKKIIIISEENTEKDIITRLLRTGINQISGFLEGGFENWVDNKKESFRVNSLEEKDLFNFFDKKKIKGKILDIRNQIETEEGIVEGSVLLELNSLKNKSFEKLDKNELYFISCGGGLRSIIGYGLLKKQGFNVINLNKGFGGLIKAGFKIIKPIIKK